MSVYKFLLQQGLEIHGFWFQKKTVQLKTALVTLESGPAPGPHLCPTSGHGKSISVSDSDTPLHYRKAACYIKSIHGLTSFKTHQDFDLQHWHSSGLLSPADNSDSHQSLRSHLDTDPWVIMTWADTSSWHLASIISPDHSDPLQPLYLAGNYTRTQDWNQPSRRYCCKLEFPVVARCDSPTRDFGNLWLILRF